MRVVPTISVAVGDRRLSVGCEVPAPAGAPRLVDVVEVDSDGGDDVLYVAVEGTWGRTDLVVELHDGSFCLQPGVLLVPETDVLFVGAGRTTLAYALGDPPRRLWRDGADTGFWAWQRCGPVVLLLAELELAAWDLAGRKLWTTFVEPPWDVDVVDDEVRLEVMGWTGSFPLLTGPTWSRPPWLDPA